MQPHEQRVLIERYKLDIDREALAKFIGSSIYYKLHTEDQELLRSQLVAMNLYSNILSQRINRFISAWLQTKDCVDNVITVKLDGSTDVYLDKEQNFDLVPWPDNLNEVYVDQSWLNEFIRRRSSIFDYRPPETENEIESRFVGVLYGAKVYHLESIPTGNMLLIQRLRP